MTDSLFEVDAAAPAAAPAAGGPASQAQSLYRKYRPQSFAADELFGQDHIVNTLKNAIRLDRIGHAYLFCGPRGTGKTTTARILAKAVNCLDPDPAVRPCNVCAACAAINAGATTDVTEIDAASNRGIDDIRDLRERVKYAPSVMRTRFYIIDEAHQITGAAANAFLKTLEEPPPHTRFVLATTDPEELLQTIVSRCQRFDFRRIGLEAMTARLTQVAAAEHISIDASAVTTIARHATGSLRDALGLLDQVAVYRDGSDAEATEVTSERVRAVLGISRNDRVEGLIAAIAGREPGAALTAIDQAVAAGEDPRQLGKQVIGYLRMLMLEVAAGSPDADDAARALAKRFTLPRLVEVTRLFAEVDHSARHSSVPQLPLELALVNACLLGEGAAAPARPLNDQPTPDTRHPGRQMDRPVEEAPPPRRGGPSLSDRVRGASIQRPAQEPPRPAPRSASEPPPFPPYDDLDDAGPPVTTQGQPPAQRPAPETTRSTPPPQRAAPESTRTVTPPTPAQAAPTGDGPSLERIVDLWDNIRMDVKAMNRRTEALLQHADPRAVSGNQLTLVAAYPFHLKRLNMDETRQVIEDVIERLTGHRMIVNSISPDEAQQLRAQAPVATSSSARPASREIAEAPGAKRSTDDGSDDPDPGPAVMAPPPPPHELIDDEVVPTTPTDDDETRLRAAINIFDAVLIEEV